MSMSVIFDAALHSQMGAMNFAVCLKWPSLKLHCVHEWCYKLCSMFARAVAHAALHSQIHAINFAGVRACRQYSSLLFTHACLDLCSMDVLAVTHAALHSQRRVRNFLLQCLYLLAEKCTSSQTNARNLVVCLSLASLTLHCIRKYALWSLQCACVCPSTTALHRNEGLASRTERA